MQRKIKIAHENILADMLGVGSGDGDDNSRFSSKKFFNLLKNSWQDNLGISIQRTQKLLCIAEMLKKQIC